MRSPPLALALAAVLLAGHAGADDRLRDPTRPYTAGPGNTAAPAPRFRVNAIIVSDDRRIAIVNGRRVGVGDHVNGATVREITKTELQIEIDGQVRTLTLAGRPRSRQ